MAKIITPVFPIEEVRGKLAGRRQLEYPNNDNAAYDSPVGSRNYARNYKTCMVACKRASDGKQYFQIKTKSAVGMTASSKKAMAVLGGTGAIIAAILRDKSAAIYATAVAAYEAYKAEQPQKETFRKWLTRYIMKGLKAKNAVISVGQILFPGMGFTFNNPWVAGGTSSNNVSVREGSLVKFWGELANNPITCTIEGLGVVIAHSGDSWGAVIASDYNVCDLTKDASGYVKSGELFVWDGEEYSRDNEVLVNGNTFMLTETQPA